MRGNDIDIEINSKHSSQSLLPVAQIYNATGLLLCIIIIIIIIIIILFYFILFL
jgi:hypothetical protein